MRVLTHLTNRFIGLECREMYKYTVPILLTSDRSGWKKTTNLFVSPPDKRQKPLYKNPAASDLFFYSTNR